MPPRETYAIHSIAPNRAHRSNRNRVSQKRIKGGIIKVAEEQDQQQVPRHLPTCPHCRMGKEKGAPLFTLDMRIGPAITVVFYCANPECGAIHSIQVLEIHRASTETKPLIHTN